MTKNSKIEWTDHTINFWWGCSKVSPACANCYAERQAARFDTGLWGPDGERRIRLEAAAKEAMSYERQAMKGRLFCLECGADCGAPRNSREPWGLECSCGGRVELRHPRPRVFTNSMADFFEDRADLHRPRRVALDIMRQTPNLDWLVLTKRPERILDCLKEARFEAGVSLGFPDWLDDWMEGKPPANVWIGTTVEDQERADQRVPALLQVPARIRFLSCEPMLGPVDLSKASGPFQPFRTIWWDTKTPGGRPPQRQGIDWVICGGESGTHARPMHPDWARGLRDQCAAAGVPFLFKQWGEWAPGYVHSYVTDDERCQIVDPVQGLMGRPWLGWGKGDPGRTVMNREGKKVAGRHLDGRMHDGYPKEVEP